MEPESDFKILRAKRLIDGNGGPSLNNQSVLIKDSEIVAVGDTQDIKAPDGSSVEVLDFGDKTIMPGMVDAHTHHVGFGDGRVGDEVASYPDEVLTIQAAKNARRALLSGVTTIRENGPKNVTSLRLRDAINEGLTIGPRMHLCGRPVSIIGGHMGYFGTTPTGPNQCREAVRQLIKEGADFIKVTASGGSTRTSFPFVPSFNVDELTAIVEEAHKFGKHVAAHCVNSQAMLNCLDAGIDTIIHARHMDSDGTYNYSPEVTNRILEQGVFVNMTLNEGRANQRVVEEIAEARPLTEREQLVLQNTPAGLEKTFDAFSRMHAAGVKMAAGSDTSWSWHKIAQFQDEIEAHVAGGMTPMEAIVAGTSNSAKSCWVEDEVGSLEIGKAGDVLVVKGDPSEDIGALWEVLDVFQEGQQVDTGDKI